MYNCKAGFAAFFHLPGLPAKSLENNTKLCVPHIATGEQCKILLTTLQNKEDYGITIHLRCKTIGHIAKTIFVTKPSDNLKSHTNSIQNHQGTL
jgi:hypothetical protein